VATFSEFSTSFAVNNIKSIESQTLNGVAVVKIYFQPGVVSPGDRRTAGQAVQVAAAAAKAD